MAEISNLSTLDDFLLDKDNSQNVVYFSKVPQICKDRPCVLGIDEAGRGPVMGPMVYGTAFCPISESVSLLEKLEAADSKVLTEEKRDSIFTKICVASNKIGWGVEVIAPNSICNSMYSRSKYSLNQVSMDSAILLIKGAIEAGVNVSQIFVDTVGKPEKYQAYLCSIFPKFSITVAKKADSTYPIVSAASICAKVTRDHSLQVWHFQEGLEIKQKEIGSGYPGDPVTKQFLGNYCDPVFGYPQLVRFSWSTSEIMLEKEAYHVEFEDPEETANSAKKPRSVMSFFKPVVTKEKKRHEFFTRRGLSITRDTEL